MRVWRLCAMAAGAAGLAGSALAAPAGLDQCFRSQDFQAFRAIDDHSFYVRAGLRDLYRIELSGACPALTEPDARLITVEHGPATICGPLDWQLRVASPSTPPIGCVVQSQTHLTAQEAAAVPPSQRP